MTNQEKYRQFSLNEPSIPIYSKGWWLDAVCDHWDACLIEKGGEVVASLPYPIKKKANKKLLYTPNFTKGLGPWLKYPEGQKKHTQISYEKKLYNQLIEQLPPFGLFEQSCHYGFKNWMPFYWQGFSQTLRYSYIIHDTTSVESIFQEASDATRRAIRKAEKKVSIKEEYNVETLWALNELTFKKQNQLVPYTREEYICLLNAINENGAGKIVIGYVEGKPVSAALFVKDEQSIYYLIGGKDPAFQENAAMSLVMWQGIKWASECKLKFDFEGGMIEKIEPFFRGFGGEQTPYSFLYKVNSPLLKMKRMLFA